MAEETQAELFKKFLKKKEEHEELKKPEVQSNKRVRSLNLRKLFEARKEFLKNKHHLEKKYGQLDNHEAKKIMQLEEMKKRGEAEEEVKKSEHERRVLNYSRTRSGRIGSGIVRSARTIQNPTKAIYGRSYITPETKKKLIETQRRNQIIRQIQNNPAQINYDWIFSNFRNPNTDIASQVEREVSFMGNSSHATCGDREAHQLDSEAFSYGNIANDLFNPFQNVNNEAIHHANFQHINPSLKTSKQVKYHSRTIIDPMFDVSTEANIFSNIMP